MHKPPGKVKTSCAWAGLWLAGTGCSVYVNVAIEGISSTKCGKFSVEARFLRTQYSKQLLERPMEEANSCIVLPLFFHSSTLANMVSCF